ncbi:MAG: flagellar biosynthesis protein FlhA [Fibrobacterota bacterium]
MSAASQYNQATGWLFGNPVVDFLVKRKDFLLLLGIIGVIVVLVIPLPPLLLDLLLSFSFAVALLILMVSMFINTVLDFSIFPGVLLITTLFKLSLNVATTRLILSTGEGGQVVEAFGSFVTGDNVVIGAVIFVILLVINFKVITSGSTRIAEVAARFTLDAMPGKQMAVDADLNAGIIDEVEAKRRRSDIQREADFFGAMDGASKFVKGEAVAGLIITAVNIVGGFAVGILMLDMDALHAMSTFTKLTIGDGLVGQIPSLMISTAAGIIVTRAASKSNLGAEVTGQLAQSPTALFLTGLVMAGLGVVPGLPTLPFLVLGAAIGLVGWGRTRAIKTEIAAKAAAALAPAKKDSKPDDDRIENYLAVDQMELEIGYALIPLVDVNQGGDLLERITMLRRQCATEMGIIVPPIRIRDNILLRPAQYIVKIKGVEIGQGELMTGSYLAMDPGTVSRKISGIPTREPAFGLPALWITESQKESAELAGYTVVELPAVLATHLTEVIRGNSNSIVSRQDVKTLIDNIRTTHGTVVDELIPALLSYGDVQRVLEGLLRERVSIRDLPSILEALSDAARVNRETGSLVDAARMGLARSLCKQLAGPDGVLAVLTLEPGLEQILEASLHASDKGPRLLLRPDLVGRILEAVGPLVEEQSAMGDNPVLVCSPGIRLPLRRLLEANYPQLSVLSYAEIVPGVQVKTRGMVQALDSNHTQA